MEQAREVVVESPIMVLQFVLAMIHAHLGCLPFF
jgi:hypothetical protein